MKLRVVFLAVLLARPALAADDGARPMSSWRVPSDEEPRLPAPFVLPELSHSRLDARVDWLVGRMRSEDPGRSNAAVGVMRASVEKSILVPRRVFFGLAYPIAMALPPDGGQVLGEAGTPAGRRTIFGNAEAHIRAVFQLPSSLEIGFVLAANAPTARFSRSEANRSAATAAGSLDPTNAFDFIPDRVALRPAGDIRLRRGRLVVQARHGIDVFIDDQGFESVRLAGRLLGHVGLLAHRDLEVSIEATQLYYFSSDNKVDTSTPAGAFSDRYRITDDRRAAFTVGPGIRWSLPLFDIGAAMVTNVNSPLSPAGLGFVAARLSVIGHFGR